MLYCVDNSISNTRETPSLLENSNTVEGWEPKNIKSIKCNTENGPDGYHNNKNFKKKDVTTKAKS